MQSRFVTQIVGLAAIAALLLAACGTAADPGAPGEPGVATPAPGAPEPGAPNGAIACPRPLTFWPALAGVELAFAQDQAQAFQQETGIAVSILDVPFANLQQQYIQATPAGQGPDLLYGLNDWIGTLAEGGFIADMTDRFDTGQYLDTTIEAVTYDGRVWGIPEAFEVVAQYYNTALLPEPAASLTELQDMQVAGGQFALAFDITNFYYAAPFLHAVGGQLFDADGNFALTEEEATTWLTAMRDLQQQAAFPQEVSEEAARALFLGGNSGSYYSGPWDVADIQAAPFEWQVAPLPAVNGQPALPFLGAKVMFISSMSDCQEAAQAFAEFFTSPQVGLAWIAEANPAHLPANTAVYDDPAVADNTIIQGFLAQAEQSVPLPNIAAMGQVWTPGEDALTSVLNAGVDPATAAQQMVNTIQTNIQLQQ